MTERTGPPATAEEIVDAFIRIPWHNRFDHNWGTAMEKSDNDLWNVNENTYINGMMLHVDFDFNLGYLLECVDGTLGTMRYIAIVTFYGISDGGRQEHDYAVYEPDCGTFFKRTEEADQLTVAQWGVKEIYRMERNRTGHPQGEPLVQGQG